MCYPKTIKISPVYVISLLLYLTTTGKGASIYSYPNNEGMFTVGNEKNPAYDNILDLVFDRAILIKDTSETEITAEDIILPTITDSICRATIKSRIIFPEIFDPTGKDQSNIQTYHCFEEYKNGLKNALNLSSFATMYILDDIINTGNETNYVDKFNNASKVLNRMEKYCLSEIQKIIDKKELCMCYATNSTTNHCKEIIEFEEMNKTINFGLFITIALIITYYIM